MIKKLTTKILVGGVVLVAVIGIGLYTNTIKLPIEKEIYTQYVADFSNDRILMGASQNVFVGKVIKQVGNEDIGIGPVTQFEVEVIHNIKGNIKGAVVVLQQGGYRNGILYTVHGGEVMSPSTDGVENLLQPGTTYLLATRNTDGQGWYYLNSHQNGSKIISENVSLSSAQLRIIAQNDEKVQKLQEAYKNEILLETDIKNNNTRNSYQSLQSTK